MKTFNDDNFGHWEGMEEEENQIFYESVQQRSVLKTCSICGRRVRILPEYDKCNSCCEAIEKGYAN